MNELSKKLYNYFCFHGSATISEISNELNIDETEVKNLLEYGNCHFKIYKLEQNNEIIYNSTPFNK